MKWFPPGVIEQVDYWNGKWKVCRKHYDNGEKSKWWIVKREGWHDAGKLHMLGFDTLSEAQRYVESQESSGVDNPSQL